MPCKGASALRLAALLGLVLFLTLVLITPAAADGPVKLDGTAVRQIPADDCAVITKMPGFPQIKTSSIQGDIVLSNEGVVIRKSYIKDGKIVIPPLGLYYTTRISKSFPIVNYPVLVLGKVYYEAEMGHNYIKEKDFAVKNGEDHVYGSGFSALELSSIGSSWGSNSAYQSATFQVLKASGNFYGGSWIVSTGGQYARSVVDAVNKTPATSSVFFQAVPVSSEGAFYLMANEVTSKQVNVGEWVASEAKSLDLATKAYTATLALNESFDLGTYKAKVTALDSAVKSVSVQIVGADGKSVADKTFKMPDDKTLSMLASDDAALAAVTLRYQDVEVALSAFADPFKETGKVKLVGYSGITRLTQGGDWPSDPRFMVIVDT